MPRRRERRGKSRAQKLLQFLVYICARAPYSHSQVSGRVFIKKGAKLLSPTVTSFLSPPHGTQWRIKLLYTQTVAAAAYGLCTRVSATGNEWSHVLCVDISISLPSFHMSSLTHSSRVAPAHAVYIIRRVRFAFCVVCRARPRCTS